MSKNSAKGRIRHRFARPQPVTLAVETGLPYLTGTERQAALTIVRHSRGAEDARELLSCCGLYPVPLRSLAEIRAMP